MTPEGTSGAGGTRRWLRWLARMVLVPGAFYLAGFCVLTWPAMRVFSRQYFADRADGLLNVWNMWWVREALVARHQSPWYTTNIHHPHGISLLGHDLGPINGFIGMALSPWLTLVQAHNAIVLLAFVGAGLFAFLLAHHFTGAWGPSLAGGYLFTFSQYHFAHAEGHLSLSSLEWIPLFALCWCAFLRSGRTGPALGSALALSGALFCNYYYFVYCLLLAVLFAAWQAIRRRDPLFLVRADFVRPSIAFLLVSAVTVAPLAVAFLWSNSVDPLLGTRDRSVYSLDLLAPLIPGGHWRFAQLTRPYWSVLPGNIHESSVGWGFALTALLAYTWRRRRSIPDPDVRFWFVPLFLFLVLALGPVLHVWGQDTRIPLPHLWLEKVVPPLRLSNAPVRMIVLCLLSASVLAAAGLERLWREGRRARLAAAVLTGLAVAETLPRPIPTTEVETPAYVEALAAAPAPGAILDTVTPPNLALYFQILHRKPLVFGRVSRQPASVVQANGVLQGLVRAGDYRRLWLEYGVRYVVTPANRPIAGAVLLCLDERAGVAVYDLAGQPRAGAGDD